MFSDIYSTIKKDRVFAILCYHKENVTDRAGFENKTNRDMLLSQTHGGHLYRQRTIHIPQRGYNNDDGDDETIISCESRLYHSSMFGSNASQR